MTAKGPKKHSNAVETGSAIWKVARVFLGERVIFAFVNLAAVAIAVRAVGLEAMGAIGLLLAFARLIGDITKFGSWKAIVSYGAPLRRADDRLALARLAGLTLWLDLAAISAAVMLVVVGAQIFGQSLGWSPEMIAIAPWFAVATVFITHMTPTGLLRLEGRVLEVASHHALTATCRLIGALWLWLAGGGFIELAAIWVGSAIIAGGLLWTFSAFSARRMFGAPDLGATWRTGASEFHGFWKFAGVTNVTATMNGAIMPFATLAVGAMLGPAEAGIFHLVRQIAESLIRPAEILAQAAFPELAKMAAEGGRKAVKAALNISGVLALAIPLFIGALLWLVGADFLELLFGAEARAGAAVLTLTGVAATLHVSAFMLEPALMTVGRARSVLASHIGGAIAFAAALSLSVGPLGLVGVGVALLAFRITQPAIQIVAALRYLKTHPSVT